MNIGDKINIRNVRAAGAYVRIGELYAFALGRKLYAGRIPIFRLGGHRNGRETGWQCAAREAAEEASIQITPIEADKTFVVYPEGHEIDRQSLDSRDVSLHAFSWDREKYPGPQPVLAAVYRKNRQTSTSLMYLAHTDQMPAPSAEVRGILLLDVVCIQRICAEPMTLGDYLQGGGKAIFRDSFDKNRFLEPFLQARVLARLLKEQLL